MTAAPTDDDIRRKLRGSALRAAEILGILVEPVLDPRAFEDGEIPDGSAMNRMLQASSKAIDAWSRTCEAPKDAPPELPAEREARLERLMANPDVRAWLVRRLAGETPVLAETNGTEAK